MKKKPKPSPPKPETEAWYRAEIKRVRAETAVIRKRNEEKRKLIDTRSDAEKIRDIFIEAWDKTVATANAEAQG